MKSQNGLILSFDNYHKISALLNSMNSAEQDTLQDELSRAQILENHEIPHDVVTMNSTVVFRDLKTKRTSKVTVVYPEEANITKQKISVLAPIGAALIGLRVGQKINWPLPNGGVRSIIVEAVIFQPETEKHNISSEASK